MDIQQSNTTVNNENRKTTVFGNLRIIELPPQHEESGENTMTNSQKK